MANSDRPRGFRPVAHRSGAPYNGAYREYAIPAADGSATFIGDPVTLNNAGGVVGSDGVFRAYVDQAATGNVIAGVVVGFAPDPTNLGLNHRTASTLRTVYVADDPDLVYEIQEVSGSTALAAADVGLNANFVVGSGSTVTGLSGVELDNTTENTTNTLDVHILGLVNRPDNEIGEHCKWLVTINRHQFANQVAGV